MENNFLSMDNILPEEDALALFADEEDGGQQEETTTPPSNGGERKNDIENPAEVNAEDLFEEEPESVGSGGTSSPEDNASEEDGNSPDNDTLYSSMASFLVEDGVFPDFDDADIEGVKGPKEFSDLVRRTIEARFEEKQKRMYDALNSGIRPDVVRQYEETIEYLDSIDTKALEEDTPQAEQLRRTLIMRDLLNKKISKERAERMVDKYFSTGDDIIEAKASLEENKKFYADGYKELRDNAAKAAAEEEKQAEKRKERIKKSILETDKIGSVTIEPKMRQKVYDNLMTPVWKNPETGDYLTAIEKFKHDDEEAYIKFVATMFTLTDGGKNLDKFVEPAVRTETKKKMQEVESKLRNSAAARYGGKLQHVSTSRKTGGKSLLEEGIELDF